MSENGNGWRARTINICGAAIVSLVLAAGVAYYFLFLPSHRLPLEFLGGSMEPDAVASPQEVQVSRRVRWFVNCEQVINNREILDSERSVHKIDPDYIRPPRLADLPPDHIVNSKKPMIIKSGLPKGPSRYRVTTCAMCREIAKEPICIVAPDLPFTVQ